MSRDEFERARGRVSRVHGGLVECRCSVCVDADWLLARLTGRA